MADIITMKDQNIEHALTGVTPSLDVSRYKEIYITLGVNEVSGTSPTFDMELEHSSDQENWKSLYEDFQQGIFPRMEAEGTETIRITKFSKYLRASWTIGGTSPSFNYDLSALAR